MARPGGRDSLVLCRIAGTHWQNLFPVLPVAICDLHRDRRADGPPVPYSGEDVGSIGLDAHAAAAAISLLASPQFPIDECLIDFESGREPLHQRDQGLAVRLTRG